MSIVGHGLGLPETGTVVADGYGLGALVGPGTTVTDVIGVTDDTDRTVAYVRIVTDSIGVTDVVIVPVEELPDIDQDERLLDRLDDVRATFPADVERLISEIDEYLGVARMIHLADLERVVERLDAERVVARLDAERCLTGLDDDRAIDPSE